MERRELVQARMQKGWTQKQAAEEIGVSESTVQRWERGECDPELFNIGRLSNVYGLSAEALGLSSTPTPAQQSPVVERSLPFQEQDLTLRLLRIPWHHDADASYHDLQRQVGQELRHMHDDVTRREALMRLALLPSEMAGISLARFAMKATPPEILAQIASGLAACWQLRKGRELAFIAGVVDRYIPALKLLMQSAQHRTDAADLLAQCYLLKGMLAWHVEGHAASVAAMQKSASYAEQAANPLLHLIAVRSQATAHYYAGHLVRAHEAAEQAGALLASVKTPVPALARSYVLAGLAAYRAVAARQQDALRAMGKAQEAFFAQSPDAPVWIDHYEGNLFLNEGKMQMFLGMHAKARDSFAQIYRDPASTAAIKVEATLAEAQAEVFRGDMARDRDFVIAKWIDGIEGAKMLQSEQRYDEAMFVYTAMRAAWPAEPRIRDLRHHLRMV